RPKARRSSTASIISIAASSGWKTSSRHAGPPSSASAASAAFAEMESARAARSISFSALRCRAIALVASTLTLALTVALALAGGADAQVLDCLGGQRAGQVAELMFGPQHRPPPRGGRSRLEPVRRSGDHLP